LAFLLKIVSRIKSNKGLIIILLLGFSLRLVFCLQFRSTPFYDHPTLDAKYYDKLAASVAKGSLIQDRAFFMGPLYPYTLGLIYSLFGKSNLAPRVFQMMLGLLCCVLLYYAGSRLRDSLTGILAAIFYAIYKPTLFYEQTLLSETPMALLFMIFILLILKTQKSKYVRSWIFVGILLGLLALFRGNVLVFIPVVCIWLLICEYRDSGRRITKKAVEKIFLFLVGSVLTIAPATIHNYIAERDFVLITSNAGFNFFIGNQEKATGQFELPPRVNMDQDPSGKRIAESDLKRSPLKSSEVSRYWKNKALEVIKNDLSRFLYLLGLKFYYFWGRAEIAQIYSMQMIQSLMPVLKFPLFTFALIGHLCLIGMGGAFFRKDRIRILLVLLAFTYALSLVPFFMTARYRLPLVPLVCLFAAEAFREILGTIQMKNWRKFSIFASCFFILFFLLDNSSLFSRKHEQAHFHNTLGLIYKTEGKVEQAVNEYHKSLIAKPSSYAYGNLASLYYDQGDLKNAINYYKRALEKEPDNARMYFNIGQAYLAAKQFQNAQESFEKANELDPAVHPLTYYNLAILYSKKGEKEKSRNAIKAYLEMKPDDEEAKKVFSLLP